MCFVEKRNWKVYLMIINIYCHTVCLVLKQCTKIQDYEGFGLNQKQYSKLLGIY